MIDIMNIYTGENTPKVVTETINNKVIKYVPYDILEDNGTYSWKYVPVSLEYYNYEGLVDVFIGLKYSLSSMLAIINNYLLDPDLYKKEFDDMQNWRKTSKILAKKHFNLL
jgi:hypothetical protein